MRSTQAVGGYNGPFRAMELAAFSHALFAKKRHMAGHFSSQGLAGAARRYCCGEAQERGKRVRFQVDWASDGPRNPLLSRNIPLFLSRASSHSCRTAVAESGAGAGGLCADRAIGIDRSFFARATLEQRNAVAPITSNGLPSLVSATLFFKALTRRARLGDSVRRERIGSSSSASRPSVRLA